MMASHVTTLFLLNVFARKLRSTAHNIAGLFVCRGAEIFAELRRCTEIKEREVVR
jgi:hypothetical protein